jgi:uncharacterized protein YndB with AHSA1/START domain
MSRDLHFEFVYAHAPSRVWCALTNSAALARWLMPNDFQPVVGHKFQFRTKPRPGFDGIVNCEVLELDPPRKLAYSWKGGGMETVVTYTLEAVPEGTRLYFDHTGFRGLRGVLVSRMLGSGWKSKILARNLPAVLEFVDNQGFHPPAAGVLPGCYDGSANERS